jgi:hypothetical protein
MNHPILPHGFLSLLGKLDMGFVAAAAVAIVAACGREWQLLVAKLWPSHEGPCLALPTG